MSDHHPTHADWMQYLYHECSNEEHGQFENHLESCSRCSDLVTDWRETIQHLDQWKIPRDTTTDPKVSELIPSPAVSSASQHRSSGPWVRWFITTACLLLAFFLGRISEPDRAEPPAQDTTAWKAEFQSAITDSLRDEFRQIISEEQEALAVQQKQEQRQMAQAMLTTYAQQDFDDRQRTHGVLKELLQNQVDLRRDLETLAVEAEALIMKTRQDLNRLGNRYQTTAGQQQALLWDK